MVATSSSDPAWRMQTGISAATRRCLRRLSAGGEGAAASLTGLATPNAGCFVVSCRNSSQVVDFPQLSQLSESCRLALKSAKFLRVKMHNLARPADLAPSKARPAVSASEGNGGK